MIKELVMNDPVSLKALPWFLKAVLVVIGSIFALVLSGDIDSNGNIKISVKFLASLAFAVSFSLSGGSAFIEYYDLTQKSLMTHGFIMLMFAVFGVLVIGILYQSIALLRGKSLAEIIAEVKSAFAAIFGGKP